MTDFLRRLATWVVRLAEPRSAPDRPVRPPDHMPASPPRARVRLPAHRSSYGLDTPIDGAATVAVRPYLVVHEQRQRRRGLAMAALGLDMPEACWIHGAEVA